jgi:hypothetical protein
MQHSEKRRTTHTTAATKRDQEYQGLLKTNRNSCSGNDTNTYLKARGNGITTTPTAQSKAVFVRTRIVSDLAPTLECCRCSWLLRISRLRCWHVLHVSQQHCNDSANKHITEKQTPFLHEADFRGR